MATDPPSPSRPLLNNTATVESSSSSPGPYYSPSSTAASTAPPRLSESSPYQATHNSSRPNSVISGTNSATNNATDFTSTSASSVNIRRASHSPPPSVAIAPPTLPRLQSPTVSHTTTSITTAPTYSRQRTPVAESSPGNVAPITSNASIERKLSPMATHHTAPNIHASVSTHSTQQHHQSSVPLSHTASTAAAQQSSSNNGYRPLNVKDALTYLDQVKVKFADQPEVYNRFLDIMKEFKSQAIDTPGVIERVSTLFRGHPALISGFNTFLPPGYRIECTTDERDRDIIKVTTPNGTTSTTSGEPLNLQSENTASHLTTMDRYYNQTPPSPQQQQPLYSSSSTGGGFRSSANGSLPPISSYHPTSHHSSLPPSSRQTQSMTHQHQQQQDRSRSPQPPTTGGETRRAPVEFNHAINYVNKIKNRFSNDPETYKQFLEILQTYQKEQKPIQEVYAQVQILFNGANDLLAEFKQFLPDTSQQQQGDFMQPTATTSTTGKGTKMKKRAMASTVPKPPKRSKTYHKMIDHHLSDIRRSPISPNTVVSDDIRPMVSLEESEFFDRVKKHINNKTAYHAFLRVLNLFSQQILDANFLIEKCEPFLGGHKDLFDQLKKLVGYDGKDIIIENLPISIPKPDFSNCQEYGPSYRSVPKSWQVQNCSGRDALCWEVLNDAYVSHPTWASEDGGFIASKKNLFEEALHRIEEERYDYDLNIEANLNTISLLEPIAKKIAAMSSEEEKNNFKLPPGLGGPSKTIYQRTIKKIYGKEQGASVIDMLHTNPAQTVPVILKRLKQKDDEWKKSQREWNKVWREVEIKNYYKALDYQGVIFKFNDRKAMSVKHLVNEIQSLHLDQGQKPNHLGNLEPQFAFQFKNKKIFKDVTRVLYSYFERQTTYGTEDCEVMKAFIEMFLPVFFDVPDVLPEIASAATATEQPTTADIVLEEENDDIVDEDENMEDDVDEDDEDENSYDSSTDTSRSTRRGGGGYSGRSSRNGRRSPRHKPSDDDHQRLLKDVLTKNVKNASGVPNKATEVKKEVISVVLEDDEEKEEEDPNKEQKIYNLFGNTTFYCFFRLFQTCYDRLCKMKQLDREYRTDPQKTKLMNKAALELNITTATFNSIDMDFKLGYYNALLKLIDRFFDDELDQHVFEECARYIFGTKAYIMFTIDKLMLSIMRQLHQIVTDPKAQELLSFFKKNHEHEKSTPQLTQAYRLEVTQALGQVDSLYNLAFDTSSRTLSIQLLEAQDETFELNDLDGYTNYVAKYIDWEHETPGVHRKDMTAQFLKRNLTLTNNIEKEDIVHRSDMQYKICRNTYHMFYVIGTEDVYISSGRKKCPVEKSSAFKSWLDKKVNADVGLDEKTRALYIKS